MPLPFALAPLMLKFASVKRFLAAIPAPLWFGLAALLVLFLVWRWHIGEVADARAEGRDTERAAWVARSEEIKAMAAALQRSADQLRAAAETRDRARIATNRKEVDDATRNIPDQGTSARQRARACIELRRRGQDSPACQS
jgi:hypothetical protein